MHHTALGSRQGALQRAHQRQQVVGKTACIHARVLAAPSGWNAAAAGVVAARAFKRNRPVDFEGFDFKGGYGPPPTNGTAWLLSTAGVGDEYYDDYDDNYEDGPPIPDQWDTMEPKYVNDRRVLINKQIESSSLRVQGMDKEDMGVMATDEARQIAREEGVDLVMISPDANPPLARLISFSKFKYEAERATKQRQKASKGVDLKELRLRPVTETHDYAVKLKQAQGFLQKGSKVKVSMAFSGRELRFKDQGKELILRFVEDLTSVGKVDGAINFKTSNFSVTMAPNK